MFLLDLSQISLASIAQERATNPNVPMEEGLVKHFIINSIRANLMKFKNTYGKCIICADSLSWRKDYFQFYKANRKEARKDDAEFWEAVYRVIKDVITIMEEDSPIPVIRTSGAEADDCIAWIVNRYGQRTIDEDPDFAGFGQEETNPEKILIVSGDKDFQQLQVYKNVEQYSPTLKKFLKCNDPIGFRMEHVARGDSGDGVPNILSPDNALVDKIRQAPITKKFMERFKDSFDDPISFEPTRISKDLFLRNYSRNLSLVDLLESIPDDVQASIEEVYIKETTEPRGSLEKLRQAFIANRMKNMLDVIADFRNKG